MPSLFALNFQTCEPKLANANYTKNIHFFEHDNCSNTEHKHSIIDHLIKLQMHHPGPSGSVETGTETQSCSSNDIHLKQGMTPCAAVCP